MTRAPGLSLAEVLARHGITYRCPEPGSGRVDLYRDDLLVMRGVTAHECWAELRAGTGIADGAAVARKER